MSVSIAVSAVPGVKIGFPGSLIILNLHLILGWGCHARRLISRGTQNVSRRLNYTTDLYSRRTRCSSSRPDVVMMSGCELEKEDRVCSCVDWSTYRLPPGHAARAGETDG